jgi:hypothetical protein
MNLSSRTAMLITLSVGLSYALTVACCVVKKQRKDSKNSARRHHPSAASSTFEPMDTKNTFAWAHMHKSGYYFFCPYCSLSFRHPPQPESFYRVGYGWCWYCVRWTPIEGGDRKGIVRIDEQGELYTDFYSMKDREERKR